jgi:hypothetical protein
MKGGKTVPLFKGELKGDLIMRADLKVGPYDLSPNLRHRRRTLLEFLSAYRKVNDCKEFSSADSRVLIQSVKVGPYELNLLRLLRR